MEPSLPDRIDNTEDGSYHPENESPLNILLEKTPHKNDAGQSVEIYDGSITTKNKLKIPRELLDSFSETIVLVRGFQQGSILLYSQERFEKIEKKLHDLDMRDNRARKLQRVILSTVYEVEIDARHNIRLPGYFKQLYELQGELVFVKQGTDISLWSKAAYEKNVDIHN